MLEKTNRTEDQIIFALRLTRNAYVNKQASLWAATAQTAEVFGLKQKLERAEEELGLVKKQLEDSQGMQ